MVTTPISRVNVFHRRVELAPPLGFDEVVVLGALADGLRGALSPGNAGAESLGYQLGDEVVHS